MDFDSVFSTWPVCPTCNGHKPAHYFEGKICKDCAAAMSAELYDMSTEEQPVDRADTAVPFDDGLGVDDPFTSSDLEEDEYGESVEDIAARILAIRALSRRRFLPFVREFKRGYMAGWAHKDICRRLEEFSDKVARNESPRLMLFMPPRSGKSELVSRNFPAWHLGKYPEHEVIACSYAASLANGFSRKVRDILRDPEYHAMFPQAVLDKESQSVENWLLTEGGGYVAAGVGGSIVGKGAHILIIDDPTKGRDEAKSETVQESIRDWYTGSAYTRLTSGGGVLIVMQRWAENDLAGWLLEQDAANEDEDSRENWEVIRYPAIAEEDEKYRRKGQALHRERYDERALKRIRATLGPRDWNALYQQNPLPEEGNLFRKNMFHWYSPSERPPLDELRIYVTVDFAVSEGEQNDFTAICVAGVDKDDRIWVLELELYKEDSLEIMEQLFRIWDMYSPVMIGAEEGQISKAVGPFYEKEMRERKQYMYIEPLKHMGRDKVVRSTSIRARMQRQGLVMFPRAFEDSEAYKQLLKFPEGKHDDAVDALAYLGMLLATLVGFKPKTKKAKVSKWREKLEADMRRKAAGIDSGDSTHMGV